VRIRVLSDLHLEFGGFEPPLVEADVVVLAGDIHVRELGVDWALAMFDCPIVYVPGNHEYYGGHFKHTFEKMKKRAAGTRLHLLNGEEAVIDGVRFLAATLWTDFSATGNTELAAAEAGECMNDYRRIRTQSYRRLRPADTLGEHYLARAFLEDRLRQPFSSKTVVVTHHAPAMASTPPHHVSDTTHLNAAYVNRLEHLMGPAVSLWIHGHTHTSFDYEINGTRVVCNPRGYAPVLLNPGFDPAFTVEIVDPTVESRA
jgi:predicted phosphodiesterase